MQLTQHTHRWVERKRVFTSPAKKIRVSSCSSDDMHKVLFGFTTVELHCADCTEMVFVVTPGDQRNI